MLESCAKDAICIELIKGVPTAIVALLVGSIAAFIAYRQYKVAEAKLNLDLFERRYAIFETTYETLLQTAINGPEVSDGPLPGPFYNLIPESHFIFGSDIVDYLLEASEKWSEVCALKSTNENYEIRRNFLSEWFTTEAATGSVEVFGEYLDFTKWR